MTPQRPTQLPVGSSINRRTVLKAGLALPLAGGLLAACSSSSGSTPKKAGSSGNNKFPGVTLQIGTNPGDQPALQEYAEGWAALTGGKAVVTVVPFAERAIKFAGFVASQDGSMDLLYADPAFVAKFKGRLFMDLKGKLDTKDLLPSVVDSVTVDGKLYSAPLSSDMNFMIYNKEMFSAAGADTPPATMDELYALADKLHVGNRYGCVLPWLASYARSYWTMMYNGSGQKMFNDDDTQVLFNNDSGLKVYEAIKAGIDGGFYDPNVFSDPGADQDTAILFAQGKGASQFGTSQYWSLAFKGDQTSLKPEVVGVAPIPAVEAGKLGTANAFEGVGVNKYTKNGDAALSFLSFMTSKEGQKNMMVNGKSGLPAVRSDVLNDPDVQKVFPIGSVLASLGTKPSSTWPTPFDTYPVFDQAVNGLIKKGSSAQQALDESVKGCNDLITKYLSS